MLQFHPINEKTVRIVLEGAGKNARAEAKVYQGDLLGEGHFEISEHVPLTPGEREVLTHAALVASGALEVA